MPTCPDCGSIIMEGDPYCPHCGAHLVWENDNENHRKRQEIRPFLGYGERSQIFTEADEELLERIATASCSTDLQKYALKSKIRQYQNAPDFKGLYIIRDPTFEIFHFHFIQENRFVRTVHVMEFFNDPEHFNQDRVFEECYSRHSHEGLLSDSRFKRMIEKSGLEFEVCGGGYQVQVNDMFSDVELTGNVRVKVYFKVNGKTRQYDLDLEKMQLEKDFREYD